MRLHLLPGRGDPEQLTAMYRMMVLCRMFDTKAIEIKTSQELALMRPRAVRRIVQALGPPRVGGYGDR